MVRSRALMIEEPTQPLPQQAPRPRRTTLIALDFDRTFTSDRRLWRAFIVGANRVGHRVLITTDRGETAANRVLLAESIGNTAFRCVQVLYCNQYPKRRQAEIAGHHVDIWIDDLPESIGALSRREVKELSVRFPVAETIPLV